MSIPSERPADFDPYQQWLGLSPSLRPYNHYTLLGLEPFEQDRHTIANAAQKKMAQVRKRRQGENAREAQILVAELSKATTCLLNANRKRLYDDHLHRTQKASEAAEKRRQRGALPPKLPAAASNSSASTDSAATPAPDSARRRSRPLIDTSAGKREHARPRSTPLLVGGGAASLVIVVVILAIRSGTMEPASNKGPIAAASLSPSAGVRPAPAAAPNVSSETTTPNRDPAVTADSAAHTAPTLPSGEFSLPADFAPPATAVPSTVPKTRPPEVPLPFAPSDDAPKALHFGGTDRVSLDAPLNSLDFAKPFTLEMWVRFDEGTYAHWLMGDLVLGNLHPEVASGVAAGWQAWIMQTEAGKQRFAIATGRGFWAEYPANDGAWRHLAVSGDGSLVAIFVDGRKAASQPVAVLADNHVPSPLPLHFGSHPYMHPTQPPGLAGELRGVRISASCRYRENFTPPDAFDRDEATELVFDFQHVASSREISDLSSHLRNGTVWGARWVALEEGDPTPASTVVAATGSLASPDASAMEPSAAGGGGETSLPLPDKRELESARQQIEALFDNEIATARRTSEHLALAAKLMSLADESADERAMQFVLFEMAIERLTQGSDLSKALKVIDNFASRFEVDRLARQAAAIEAAGNGPLTVTQRRELADAALGAGEAMKREGRYDLAESVAQTAVMAATRARNPELGKRARQLRDDAKRSRRLAVEAELAREQLIAAPDDPAANLTYGKFLCLHRNQWDAGAAMLAKSSDEMLQRAAAAEVEAAEDPSALAAAAELWYESRSALDKSDVPPLLDHVVTLSRAALPGLKGIEKLTVEKRMTEIVAELPAQKTPAIPESPADPRFEPPPEFQSLVGRLQVDGRDASILWKYRSGLRLSQSNVKDVLVQTGLAGQNVQIDFVGKLRLPETTTVNVTQQGGSPMDAKATLYVDGKLVGIQGGDNATTGTYKLDLAKGEHTVAWQLAGRDLSSNSLQFNDADSGLPLVIYHDAPLLAAVRDTPSRARLTVNLMGGL